MPKKSHDELALGARVRVKAGTTMPEFPDVACGGWVGSIVETSGKKPNTKYIVEWDEATLATMPEPYLKLCEAQGLYHRMACLEGSALEAAG
ncbi:MAG TPA: hypothetical protein VFG04_00830 [Planctomycetaceae bacterium]|jgi:hypothetical protein|nr:hypothetical protein [Planctomycetaceae bacterium]